MVTLGIEGIEASELCEWSCRLWREEPSCTGSFISRLDDHRHANARLAYERTENYLIMRFFFISPPYWHSPIYSNQAAHWKNLVAHLKASDRRPHCALFAEKSRWSFMSAKNRLLFFSKKRTIWACPTLWTRNNGGARQISWGIALLDAY